MKYKVFNVYFTYKYNLTTLKQTTNVDIKFIKPS